MPKVVVDKYGVETETTLICVHNVHITLDENLYAPSTKEMPESTNTSLPIKLIGGGLDVNAPNEKGPIIANSLIGTLKAYIMEEPTKAEDTANTICPAVVHPICQVPLPLPKANKRVIRTKAVSPH